MERCSRICFKYTQTDGEKTCAGLCEANQWDVHETHCCKECGCKYGNDDCPMVLGIGEQRYDCPDCLGDVIDSREGPSLEERDELLKKRLNLTPEERENRIQQVNEFNNEKEIGRDSFREATERAWNISPETIEFVLRFIKQHSDLMSQDERQQIIDLGERYKLEDEAQKW